MDDTWVKVLNLVKYKISKSKRYIYMCVCVCVHIYIYIPIERSVRAFYYWPQ